MGSRDLSLDDLNGGFLGVEYLILHVDYAMALNVEYDKQPGDPQVSLILGPARYESQMIDECLAEHRDELSIRLLLCPGGAHFGTTVRRDTICKGCGSPLEAVRDTSEEWLRKQAWERLRWELPGFQARSVVPKWLVQARYEGVAQPPELCVPLSLVFRLLLEEMQGTRRRYIRECWDHLRLGKSVGDVLPRGDTIEEKLRHYLIVRDKLTAGYNWMLGSARQYPEFKDGWDEFQGIRRFPPPVTLPKAPESQPPPAEPSDDDEHEEVDRPKPAGAASVETANGGPTAQGPPAEDDDAPPEQQVTLPDYKRLLKIKKKIDPCNEYIGQSVAILRVFQQIERLNTGSRAEKPVLICGPSGSGKSKIAELIHSSSSRKTGPFLRVSATVTLDDLTAMKGEWFGVGANSGITNMDPKGKKGHIQKSNGGTLFVDEVADLPIVVQEPLRDVIDRESFPLPLGEGDPVEPNVRLVLATYRSEKLTDKEAFLPDLYDRMRRGRIDIPPLNKRREDIFDFVNARRGKRKVAFRFWWALLSRDWAQGNVRALIDVLDAVFDEISDSKQAVTAELLLRIRLDPSEPAFEVAETDEDKARDEVIGFLTGVFEAQGFTKNRGLQKRIADSVGYDQTTVSKWLR